MLGFFNHKLGHEVVKKLSNYIKNSQEDRDVGNANRFDSLNDILLLLVAILILIVSILLLFD